MNAEKRVASRKVRDDLILSELTVTYEVEVPWDKIDIATWLKTLPDHEYQRCAPGEHKAAGYTTDDDGTPMSINVEMIGTSLVVQQYRYEIAKRHHCHMVSISDVLTPNGWTTQQVIWDLRMEKIDDQHARYHNLVRSHPTEEFLAFIETHGQTFEEAAAARQAASANMTRLETPCTPKASHGLRAPTDRKGTRLWIPPPATNWWSTPGTSPVRPSSAWACEAGCGPARSKRRDALASSRIIELPISPT